MQVGLPFAAVLEGVRVALGFSPERGPAILARIRNLIRGGFPEGVSTGRGTRVAYSLDQFAAILTVQMLGDAFVPPEPAMRLVGRARDAIRTVLSAADLANEGPIVENTPKLDAQVLVLRSAALWQLRIEGSASDSFEDHNRLVPLSVIQLRALLPGSAGTIILVVDLGARMRSACQHLVAMGWLSQEAIRGDLLSYTA